MTPGRSIALTLVLSLLLAGLGAWGGATYTMHAMHAETPLHELVHEKLQMSTDQQRRIEGLEHQGKAFLTGHQLSGARPPFGLKRMPRPEPQELRPG